MTRPTSNPTRILVATIAPPLDSPQKQLTALIVDEAGNILSIRPHSVLVLKAAYEAHWTIAVAALSRRPSILNGVDSHLGARAAAGGNSMRSRLSQAPSGRCR